MTQYAGKRVRLYDKTLIGIKSLNGLFAVCGSGDMKLSVCTLNRSASLQHRPAMASNGPISISAAAAAAAVSAYCFATKLRQCRRWTEGQQILVVLAQISTCTLFVNCRTEIVTVNRHRCTSF